MKTRIGHCQIKKKKKTELTLSKHLEKLVGRLGFSIGTFPSDNYGG